MEINIFKRRAKSEKKENKEAFLLFLSNNDCFLTKPDAEYILF